MKKKDKWVIFGLCLFVAGIIVFFSFYHTATIKKYADKGITIKGNIQRLEQTRSGRTTNNIVYIEYLGKDQQTNTVSTKEYIDNNLFENLHVGDEIEFVYLPDDAVNTQAGFIEYKSGVILKKAIEERQKDNTFSTYFYFAGIVALLGLLPFLKKRKKITHY